MDDTNIFLEFVFNFADLESSNIDHSVTPNFADGYLFWSKLIIYITKLTSWSCKMFTKEVYSSLYCLHSFKSCAAFDDRVFDM